MRVYVVYRRMCEAVLYSKLCPAVALLLRNVRLVIF